MTINNMDITPFIESIGLSGDTTKFHRSLVLRMIATEDGRQRAFTFEEGDTITFKYDNVVRFVGIVFAYDISSDGSLSLTAHDSNAYLAKSTDALIFKNKKASDIIRILAADFGIPLGSVADTGYVIPYVRLSKLTLYSMMLKVLKITRNQTNKRFFIGNVNGKLTLTAGTSNTRYLFKDGENLISASYSRSIEATRTQAKVIGGTKGKETVVVVKDDAKRAKYGVLQAFEEMDEKATPSQVKQRAHALLKEQSEVAEQLQIHVLGVPEVDVGTPVYIVNKMTATNGAYYVTSINHTYAAGLHEMTLELTRTYELPDIDITAGD
ncbi:hypothetical protein CD32_03785 [Lysinibacillus odysseyi 34hs-1 = NBRC 100172]|uniref:YqbQ/XkdQ domain-containing protein n=1 Tax=Lysinibacillus odysseyi 34hs-1 = NBRC 100172 TaxID=1220589 RepID=A0A0A3IVF0_9BACI|nr:hypothetical protein CD32_03785 [Lysinibacillus odysseyi 34hs-1 = NBRC 100172]